MRNALEQAVRLGLRARECTKTLSRRPVALNTNNTSSCPGVQSFSIQLWKPPRGIQEQVKPHSLDCRQFSTSRHLCKGKKNKIRENEGETSQSIKTKIEKAGNANDESVVDGLTLVSLNTEISRIHHKLKKSLSELMPSGRFNPAWIEALRVDLSKLQQKDPLNSADAKQMNQGKTETHEAASKVQKDKKAQAAAKQTSRSTVPLSELAQVIPRGGKTVLVMLNEEAFSKPVSSAILSSPYSLNPQPSTTNPLELTVPIPAPSAESRKQTVSSIDKFRERAESDLREGRGAMLKSLRGLHLERKIHSDSFHEVQKRMERVVDEAKAEIKRVSDMSRKALQSG